MPAPIQRFASLPPFVFARIAEQKRAYVQEGHSVVDLSLGSPDQPTPAPIIEALRTAALEPGRHGYPGVKGDPGLRSAFAAWARRRFDVALDPETEVVPTIGATEALAQLIMLYCGEGDILLLPDVAYPVYERQVLAVGAAVYPMPLSAKGGWWPDFSEIPADVVKRARVLLLNYPNNPIGSVATRAQWQDAVDFAHKHDLLLISDLAYSELTYDGRPAVSVFEADGARDVAVEVHSGSKNFSMAGHRLGVVAANQGVCSLLHEYQLVVGYGVPAVVQAAGAFAYQHAEDLSRQVRDGYQARYDAAVAGFAEGGLPVAPPAAGMYFWLPIPQGVSDWEFFDRLMRQAGVIVTPGSGFGPGGKGYVRVSLVAPPEVLHEACRRAAGVWR